MNIIAQEDGDRSRNPYVSTFFFTTSEHSGFSIIRCCSVHLGRFKQRSGILISKFCMYHDGLAVSRLSPALAFEGSIFH